VITNIMTSDIHIESKVDEGSSWVNRLSRVDQVEAEPAVVLPAGTHWQVPWELMMLGPFRECVLDDGQHMRHVTAEALLSSAARRALSPMTPLIPSDYVPILQVAPHTTLLEAVKLIVEPGWERALVMDVHPKLITPRCVLRLVLATAQFE
jgi:hypothetical protein